MVSCLVLIYFAQNKLVTFDHSDELYAAAQHPHFDTKFAQVMKKQFGKINNHIVHFSSEQCWCQIVAASHIVSVKKLAEETGLVNIAVARSELNSDISAYVPSYPAVAVFNASGKLTYFGPYSSGIYCTKGNGLVEPFILNSENSLPSAALPLDATGCYCKG